MNEYTVKVSEDTKGNTPWVLYRPDLREGGPAVENTKCNKGNTPWILYGTSPREGGPAIENTKGS